ncbi:MAG: hypothetical protein E7157_05675 [Lactobacillales bacterium]|nr:hypothetical protein [Lactobacillales bacterium]
MEQNEYIQKLMQQFINSQGIKNIDVNSIEFKKEFVMWIDERKNISEGYIKLLEKLKVPYNTSEMVEIGKGKYDSIVLNNGSTIMLTPYLMEKGNNPLCLYRFTVEDMKPAVILNNGNIRNVPLKSIMTHNPYDESDICDWEKLFNHDSCNITIGIFGKHEDKDKKSKIKMLEDFKKELYLGSNMTGYESCGNYYYAITSHGKKIQKIK